MNAMDVDGEGEGGEEEEEQTITAADILGSSSQYSKAWEVTKVVFTAMRCRWVDGLHQKALEGFPVKPFHFGKLIENIGSIIVGRMSQQGVERYKTGWLQLQKYGNFACQTEDDIAPDVIGWKCDTNPAPVWKDVLHIVKWIEEAKVEIQKEKDKEGEFLFKMCKRL